MRRRDFIAGLGAVAWPLAASAQRTSMRHIGVLSSGLADGGTALISVFAQGLQERGWTIGTNVRIDYRWGATDDDLRRKFAAELVALKPGVILTTAGSLVGALQEASRTVPIVFTTTIDPVGGGWVASLSHPGGNATGFLSYEFSIAGKWLELLKEIAPGITHVAVMRDPSVPAGTGGFAAIQTAAPSFRVELTPIRVGDTGEIAQRITEFTRAGNGGLIVVGPISSMTPAVSELIISLAARHRLPAVYSNPFYVINGGLVSYGPDRADQVRRAAGYVDRILRGEKPSDLPVQAPVKYVTVLNLKTAKALGIEVPPAAAVRADEVIE
jgi:putative tryptophan/tyrosine transport system substrate-binding protein